MVRRSTFGNIGLLAATGIAWVCAVSQQNRMGFRLVYGPNRTSDAESGLLDSPSIIERVLSLAMHSPSMPETVRQASEVECTQVSETSRDSHHFPRDDIVR
jgi:hypothetical protein